jgi:hypothetical protein
VGLSSDASCGMTGTGAFDFCGFGINDRAAPHGGCDVPPAEQFPILSGLEEFIWSTIRLRRTASWLRSHRAMRCLMEWFWVGPPYCAVECAGSRNHQRLSDLDSKPSPFGNRASQRRKHASLRHQSPPGCGWHLFRFNQREAWISGDGGFVTFGMNGLDRWRERTAANASPPRSRVHSSPWPQFIPQLLSSDRFCSAQLLWSEHGPDGPLRATCRPTPHPSRLRSPESCSDPAAHRAM